jgi:glycerol-3-phosphate dehydrogenase
MKRSELLAKIRTDQNWDVIVIGGGATGLGTAVDAATRGYKTLLVEAHDFAKGTSSRSTKLVHGGVRYLAQGNVTLVYEALKERGRLRQNAPHLVKPLPFVVPSYKFWSKPFYGAGLTLYSMMAGKLGLGFSKLINKKEALRLAPTLEPDGLRGGVVYYDGQFDDARLALALMLSIFDAGGVALNYMPVIGVCKDDTTNKVNGVRIKDAETGEEFELRARAVVNATGVYADNVRKLDEPTAPVTISPSQGIHLVLDKSFLPGDHAIMIPKTDDGRVLFAVPWHNRVIIGTTDTPVERADLEPKPMADEIKFLLEHTARYLTKDPTPDDVLSIYVGLRPLVKPGNAISTAAISREHHLEVSSSGLITITGGKWTTYRNMAEDTVSKAAEVGGLPKVESRTKNLHLHGYDPKPEVETDRDNFGIYGSDAPALRKVLAENPEWETPLHERLPYRTGEIVWAARHELARTVEDFLSRRTRSLLLDARACIEVAPKVAELMAAELGHDAGWVQHQIEEFNELAQGYLLNEGLIVKI